MALDYFPCYNSYLETTAKLTNEELGRLFRALMAYSKTGERQELDGIEALAFDFMVKDIDRAKENYAVKCEVLSANGKKGGRPKKQMVFSETKKSQSKSESKSKSESNVPYGTESPLPPLPSKWGEGLQSAVRDWFAYKAEKRQQYKEVGAKKLITQIENAVKEHGESAVIGVIDRSIAANYQGIVWDWLKPEVQGKQPQTAKNDDFCKSSFDIDDLKGLSMFND